MFMLTLSPNTAFIERITFVFSGDVVEKSSLKCGLISINVPFGFTLVLKLKFLLDKLFNVDSMSPSSPSLIKPFSLIKTE